MDWDQQHWELVKATGNWFSAVLRCGLLQSNLCGTAADAQAVSDYQQPFWAEDRCWVAAVDLGSSVGTPRFLAETTMVQWNCWPGGRFEMENREFIHLHTLTPEVVHKREPAEYAVPTFDGRGSSSVRHPLNDFTGQLIHSRILLVVLDSYPSFYLKGGFKSVTFPYSCYDALQVTRAHTHTKTKTDTLSTTHAPERANRCTPSWSVAAANMVWGLVSRSGHGRVRGAQDIRRTQLRRDYLKWQAPQSGSCKSCFSIFRQINSLFPVGCRTHCHPTVPVEAGPPCHCRNFKATTGRTFALIDSGLSEPQGLALDHDRGAWLGWVAPGRRWKKDGTTRNIQKWFCDLTRSWHFRHTDRHTNTHTHI